MENEVQSKCIENVISFRRKNWGKNTYIWRKKDFRIEIDINNEANKRCIYENKLAEILDELPSMDWIAIQEEYIQNLPEKHKNLIKRYTEYPYFIILNEYLRHGGINRCIIDQINSIFFDKALLKGFNSIDEFIKDFYEKTS